MNGMNGTIGIGTHPRFGWRHLLACASAAALVIASPPAHAAGVDCSIEPAMGLPGINCRGMEIAVYDDGTGPALFVGGDFDHAGGNPMGEIAKWDGREWSPLGLGTVGAVWGLTVFDPGPPSAGTKLYCAGNFVSAGGVPASQFASWDGKQWESIFWSASGGFILARAIFDDGTGPAMYMGGTFTGLNGVPASRIAKWDGTTFAPVGGGMNAAVTGLIVGEDESGSVLIASGTFTEAGGVPANRMAKWNGKAWSAFGAGPTELVTVMAAGPNHTVHIVGQSTRLHRWNGSTWTINQNAIGGSADAIVVDADENVYVGGAFSMLGRLAKWNGTRWMAIPVEDVLGCSTSPHVNALLIHDDDGLGPSLFVGGTFKTIGGQPANGVAKLRLPIKMHDMTCDGVIDVSDLLAVISAWGPCPDEGACPADADRDGQVQVSDLLLIIGGWGS